MTEFGKKTGCHSRKLLQTYHHSQMNNDNQKQTILEKMTEVVEEDLQRAAQLIKNASFILVLSGAGMSAESGLKTYEEINRLHL